MKANKIIALRGRLGLSQEQFGRLVGVSGSSISSWELGHREPPRQRVVTMERLADGDVVSAATLEGKEKSSRVGRHRVAAGEVQKKIQELEDQLLKTRIETTIKYVTAEYELPSGSFRAALVVFLYGVGSSNTSEIASILAGYE